jgi:hypothetical protein
MKKCTSDTGRGPSPSGVTLRGREDALNPLDAQLSEQVECIVPRFCHPDIVSQA